MIHMIQTPTPTRRVGYTDPTPHDTLFPTKAGYSFKKSGQGGRELCGAAGLGDNSTAVLGAAEFAAFSKTRTGSMSSISRYQALTSLAR